MKRRQRQDSSLPLSVGEQLTVYGQEPFPGICQLCLGLQGPHSQFALLTWVRNSNIVDVRGHCAKSYSTGRHLSAVQLPKEVAVYPPGHFPQAKVLRTDPIRGEVVRVCGIRDVDFEIKDICKCLCHLDRRDSRSDILHLPCHNKIIQLVPVSDTPLLSFGVSVDLYRGMVYKHESADRISILGLLDSYVDLEYGSVKSLNKLTGDARATGDVAVSLEAITITSDLEHLQGFNKGEGAWDMMQVVPFSGNFSLFDKSSSTVVIPSDTSKANF